MLPMKSRTFQAKGRTFTHHFLDSPEVAVIVPILPDGRFVLVRQYRAALDRETLEFPAGKLEGREPAEEGARRELGEETGYRADTLDYRFSFYPVPGYSTELIHVFVATGLDAGATDFDDAEDLYNVALTEDELSRAIADGRLRDGKTLLAFFGWRLDARAAYPAESVAGDAEGPGQPRADW